ncbi:MAG TPA: hypothetical protein ACFYD2_07105 [Candidatus Avalokitesvara rifleensis]|uniref:hypothetical protein n=1 Tax=Candidatus Avalokitesvara rifleensis TaxID=3367620 RepID=UPI002712766A|nr:hypothetical protein [Candidatus Brocadiales bacterium]
MKISKQHKKLLIDEFKYVSKKMREGKHLSQKCYFFSAAHGMVNRVLNIEFDPTLVLVHNTLNGAHSVLNTTVERIVSGQETTIQVTDSHFEAIAKALEDLGNKIEKGQDVTSPLQTISNIGYAATGNGFYLHQKGILTF